ncbi:hypothetical protein N9I83_00540 [bacterium]|jgi:hypothetical protein|nr:hypothetical protein [bacterium]|tara:strand:+ start:425 stop:733 length:309 start_codon:yes stop_codon:yes gene_type:complete
MEHKFVKHFARLITDAELSNDDVAEYYDIVESHIPTKVVIAYTDDHEMVSAEVTLYSTTEDRTIYEVVLQEAVDEDEGDAITAELLQVFPDIDFDFESSLEI